MISTTVHEDRSTVANAHVETKQGARIWRAQPSGRARIDSRRVARERARSLPGRAWMIVAAGGLAWAVVAIPAYMLFG